MAGPRLTPDMPIGRRIAAFRTYGGRTQAQCAVAVGKSLSWWKQVEAGQIHVRTGTLVDIARVVNADYAELLGSPIVTEDNAIVHPAVPAVRAAMMDYALSAEADAEPPSLQYVRAAAEHIWQLWHNSPHFYTDVGLVLPHAITDARAAYRAAEGARKRRDAARALAEVYRGARMWLRKVGEHDLSLVAADRAMTHAQEADDLASIASSAWHLSALSMAMGEPEEAATIALDGAALLRPRLDDAAENVALFGSLHLYAAIATARSGDGPAAERMWDVADEASRRLGDEYVHPQTVFGRVNVGCFAVSIPVELGKTRQALHAVERIEPETIPGVERRSRHLIDVARAYIGKRDDIATLHVLQAAYKVSPEEVRYSIAGREMVREMRHRDQGTIRAEVRSLASAVGLSA